MDVSGSLGELQKYEELRSPHRKKKKKDMRKDKIDKIKREGRSRVDSSPRKVCKGKIRGQAPDSYAIKAAKFP